MKLLDGDTPAQLLCSFVRAQSTVRFRFVRTGRMTGRVWPRTPSMEMGNLKRREKPLATSGSSTAAARTLTDATAISSSAISTGEHRYSNRLKRRCLTRPMAGSNPGCRSIWPRDGRCVDLAVVSSSGRGQVFSTKEVHSKTKITGIRECLHVKKYLTCY